MDKGKIDKNSHINVFEIKPIRREFNYKLSAADVFNEFLYIGDDKGNRLLNKVISTTIPYVLVIQKSSLNLLNNKSKIFRSIGLINCSAMQQYHPYLYSQIKNFMLLTQL